MEFLFMWVGSVIASGAMEVATTFRIMKDVADSGYKIDMKRISEFNNQVNLHASRMAITTMFIPVINMMQAMRHGMEYNNNRFMLIDQFATLDALEEMTEEEKREYQKKPTGFHALQIFATSEMRKDDASIMRIRKDGKECQIFFEKDPEEDITVLKVEGDFSLLRDADVREFLLEEAEKDSSTSEDQLEQLKELRQEIQEFKKHLEEQEEEKGNPYVKK